VTGAAALGKEVKSMTLRIVASLALVLAAGALAGCGKHQNGQLIGNQLPVIQLSFAPAEGSTEYYSRRLNWFAFDPDGQVTGYQYAVDPTPGGDTTWVETTSSEVSLFFRSPNPQTGPSSGVQISLGFHTFVVKARDNLGALSPPAFVSFNSRTVAPATSIIVPLASASIASTTPSLTITWRGEDVDGVLTQKPIKYKYKLAPASEVINPQSGATVNQQVQQYFGQDAATFFATWDSVPGDTTFKDFSGLTAGTVYFFAVVAFDEAGAYEPNFVVGSNVLRFRPSLDRLGPEITVFNEFFVRKQSFGGIDPTRFVRLEIPADNAVTFNWFAEPPAGAAGTVITGYRWALDIDDISNEDDREDDNDFKHWSPWSAEETSATIGPFAGSTDTLITHNFYVEAQDNIHFISLFAIQLTIVKPTFKNPLLVVDDENDTVSQTGRGFIGSYPMEAEADSFYFARGGFGDSIGIQWANNPDAISTPGMFADFAFDTIDYYHSYPNEGILLSKLADYRVVAWFTDNATANRNTAKFGSSDHMPAIRFINSISQLNTLAVYLRQNGKAWLFGEGMTQAVANGFVSRFNQSGAQSPFTTGEDAQDDILQLGNFLYDFIHLRSEVRTAGTSNQTSTFRQQMHSCIPYLPAFRCTSPPPTFSRTCDPRIGPTAEENVEKWGALPQLTIRAYRGLLQSNPDERRYYPTFVISQPLFITEGVGTAAVSVLDTLYINAAVNYDPNRTRIPPSDGFPNALYYHGSAHGEVVWFGFPMHFFEVDQARLTTKIVLQNLGLTPAAPGAPRGAHAPALDSGGRVIADIGFYDPRRKTR
jgi:hypothetical protein